MNTDFIVNNDQVHLGFKLSSLERKLFLEFETMLLEKGYLYLSLPSSGIYEVIRNQEVILESDSLGIDNKHVLYGSAEQGFLEYFKDKTIVNEMKLFSTNQCFRNEPIYNGMKTLIEFKKLEQFIFCKEENWSFYFDEVLKNSTDFLEKYQIKYRIVDKTKEDHGYHIKKLDIEVLTEQYGWMETHSCTYFKKEQMKRMPIYGDFVTISNTGIASPRILIPFIEKNKKGSSFQ